MIISIGNKTYTESQIISFIHGERVSDSSDVEVVIPATKDNASVIESAFYGDLWIENERYIITKIEHKDTHDKDIYILHGLEYAYNLLNTKVAPFDYPFTDADRVNGVYNTIRYLKRVLKVVTGVEWVIDFPEEQSYYVNIDILKKGDIVGKWLKEGFENLNTIFRTYYSDGHPYFSIQKKEEGEHKLINDYISLEAVKEKYYNHYWTFINGTVFGVPDDGPGIYDTKLRTSDQDSIGWVVGDIKDGKEFLEIMNRVGQADWEYMWGNEAFTPYLIKARQQHPPYEWGLYLAYVVDWRPELAPYTDIVMSYFFWDFPEGIKNEFYEESEEQLMFRLTSTDGTAWQNQQKLGRVERRADHLDFHFRFKEPGLRDCTAILLSEYSPSAVDPPNSFKLRKPWADMYAYGLIQEDFPKNTWKYDLEVTENIKASINLGDNILSFKDTHPLLCTEKVTSFENGERHYDITLKDPQDS